MLAVAPLFCPPLSTSSLKRCVSVDSRPNAQTRESKGLGFKSQPQISCLIAKIPFARVSAYQTQHGYFFNIRPWSPSSNGRRSVRTSVVCETQKNEDENVTRARGDQLRSWILNSARKRQESLGERIMRMVAGASSAPIAQYIPFPVTPLHTLDPRVKQVFQWAQCGWESGLAFGSRRASCSITHGDSDFHGCFPGRSNYVHASSANLAGPTRPHGCTLGIPFRYACFGN